MRWHRPVWRLRLDRTPSTRQSPRPGWAVRMKLLSHLSPYGDGLPEPADARRLALGVEAWNEALASDGAEDNLARQWREGPPGKRRLAAIFGITPFATAIRVKDGS